MTHCLRKIVGIAAIVALPASLPAQTTQRVSVGWDGSQATAFTVPWSITPDGRYVVLESTASNLVPDDTNQTGDVFVRDLWTGTTELVSLDSRQGQSNGYSKFGSISADGRYVCFDSYASNLSPNDSNGTWDVFVRDRALETTELISVGLGGESGDDDSQGGHISADGRFVVFVSNATDLVAGPPPVGSQVFVRDRVNGTTEAVSVGPSGPANADSFDCSITADGRFVSFVSFADNLVPGDSNFTNDLFVHDRTTGTNERMNVTSSGAESSGDVYEASISADGRFVVFADDGPDLVPGDTNDTYDIFVHDRRTGTTERVSVDSSGNQGDVECISPSISADGRYVTFATGSRLVDRDTNGRFDVFLRDRQAETTERLSLASSGIQGNDHSGGGCQSTGARIVAFSSAASNLVPGDSNGAVDAFVRDRFGEPSFTRLCEPGDPSIVGCPCSNPPGARDRGCDNSAHSGGATLTATGGTILSSDSLILVSEGVTTNVLGLVLQGDGVVTTGVVGGQGVRCVGGSLRRLYTKTAEHGTITAPEFARGDVAVSQRSASIGDVIRAGESRWYSIAYRDPHVPSGCPPTSTFNYSPTGSVTWAP